MGAENGNIGMLMKGSGEVVEHVPGPEGPAIMRNPECRVFSDEEVLIDLINSIGRQLFKQIVLAEPKMFTMFEPALKHLKRQYAC
jgi:hypothetical protein